MTSLLRGSPHPIFVQSAMMCRTPTVRTPAVTLTATVSNAHPAVLENAQFVTQRRGGEGVIVELSELLLRAQNNGTLRSAFCRCSVETMPEPTKQTDTTDALIEWRVTAAGLALRSAFFYYCGQTDEIM